MAKKAMGVNALKRFATKAGKAAVRGMPPRGNKGTAKSAGGGGGGGG